MKVGSFTPEQSDRVLYAMAGDDCSLHHDLDRLTAKQQIDHRENQVLTCALQVALIGLGKPTDHIALAREFSQAPWSDLLSHYRHMFTSMGLPTIPGAQQQFFDLDGFYAACADNSDRGAVGDICYTKLSILIKTSVDGILAKSPICGIPLCNCVATCLTVTAERCAER